MDTAVKTNGMRSVRHCKNQFTIASNRIQSHPTLVVSARKARNTGPQRTQEPPQRNYLLSRTRKAVFEPSPEQILLLRGTCSKGSLVL